MKLSKQSKNLRRQPYVFQSIYLKSGTIFSQMEMENHYLDNSAY